jgi:hypothetical protein
MTVTRTSVGTMASGISAITATFGTGAAAGDTGLLFVETANQAPTTPTGWSQLFAGTGFGTGGAAGASRLVVYIKLTLTSGDISGGVSIADSGDHQNAWLVTYSGVDTASGFTTSSTNEVATATTAVSTSSVSAVWGRVGGIVLAVIATDRDSATASTNSSPSWNNITGTNSFIENQSSATGAGGGFVVNELVVTDTATAGFGFTCNITSSAYTSILVVLMPPPVSPPFPNLNPMLPLLVR